MKGLLLRVGIDKGCGGCLSPFFKNGKFEFIPIPEDEETSETKTYATMKGRTGRKIRDLVPKRIWSRHPHNDPEFDTFTYGDPTKIKRCQISQLGPGDLLIFYAGIQSYEGTPPKKAEQKHRLFVIGYFEVERVNDFKKIPKEKWESAFRKVKNNAHAKRYFKTEELVIVKGNAKGSKLLSKLLLLGNNKNHMLRQLKPIFGYKKDSLQRAVGHWIDEEHIAQVRKWLRTKANLSFG